MSTVRTFKSLAKQENTSCISDELKIENSTDAIIKKAEEVLAKVKIDYAKRKGLNYYIQGCTYVEGRCFKTNQDNKIDYKKAVKYFKKSISHNIRNGFVSDGNAAAWISYCYFEGGPNLIRNTKKAEEWFREALKGTQYPKTLKQIIGSDLPSESIATARLTS